jgi:hypothetical protein
MSASKWKYSAAQGALFRDVNEIPTSWLQKPALIRATAEAQALAVVTY